MSIAPIMSGVALLRQALEDSGTTGQKLAARTAERDRHEREDPAVQTERTRQAQRALLGLLPATAEPAPIEPTSETTTTAALKQQAGVPVKA